MQRGAGKNWQRKTLASENTCSCHPKQWGLKKALRRARRRVDRDVVLLNLDEVDTGTAPTLDP